MPSVYQQFVRHVKRKLPELHLSITRVRVPADIDGYCEKIGQAYHISIDNSISEQTAIYVLIHEIAHAIDGCEHNHGQIWGSRYATAYRLFLDFVDDCS